MGPLAVLAQRLATDVSFREEFGRGNAMGLVGLIEDERAAVEKLRPLLVQDPEKLGDSVREMLSPAGLNGGVWPE
jgi:hypothetical protein